MSLKKAKETINGFRKLMRASNSYNDQVTYYELELALEALAEPDEGEEQFAILDIVCPACGQFTHYRSDEPKPDRCWQCKRDFASPAFTFGDLVTKDGKPGIVQNVKETILYILDTHQNHLAFSIWEIKEAIKVESN